NLGTSSVKSGRSRVLKIKLGRSIPKVMGDLIEVGQTMGNNIEGCLGQLVKIRWIEELNRKHKVNFVAIQETKIETIDLFSIKELWGNLSVDYVLSSSVGFSGGTWIPTPAKMTIITVYAPQDISEQRTLWDYIIHLIDT
nr:RNA-directed DNA polymerase, eukaryota [Tanacetum cinerariifolium]